MEAGEAPVGIGTLCPVEVPNLIHSPGQRVSLVYAVVESRVGRSRMLCSSPGARVYPSKIQKCL